MSFYCQLLRQLRAFALCEGELDFKRDWILKWRPDLRVFGLIDWESQTDVGAISLPSNDNFGGYNDQLALGPAALMSVYFKRIERLGEYFAVGGRVQPEGFLKWCLAEVPVRDWPVPYCIDRGTHLQPVVFAKEWGDTLNASVIEKLTGAGVIIDTEVREPICPGVPFPACGRFGQYW